MSGPGGADANNGNDDDDGADEDSTLPLRPPTSTPPALGAVRSAEGVPASGGRSSSSSVSVGAAAERGAAVSVADEGARDAQATTSPLATATAPLATATTAAAAAAAAAAAVSAAAAGGRQIVVVSGLAGAGKTTAARALEDLGFFVVDNLPPQLIETLITMAEAGGAAAAGAAAGGAAGLRRLAFVIDAREATFLREFPPTWDRLRKAGQHQLMLVFLDCSDEVLVRRFKETRRRHPLDEGDGVVAGIQRERALLKEVSARADVHVDTRKLSVHELKRSIAERFGMEAQQKQLVTVLSFGFKHGLPHELDLCFDVRFLPNPFFVDELRALSGNDAAVQQYVLAQPDTAGFVDRVEDLVAFLLPRFEHEGKTYVTVAIGCTGGRHRSPTIANVLGQRLRARGVDARVVHRDIDQG